MPTTNHIAPPPCRLLSAMEEYLVDFNATSKRPMNLAMFLFAVEHVSGTSDPAPDPAPDPAASNLSWIYPLLVCLPCFLLGSSSDLSWIPLGSSLYPSALLTQSASHFFAALVLPLPSIRCFLYPNPLPAGARIWV